MIIRERRRVASGRILRLEDWLVEFPEGSATYQMVLHDGAAAVIAIDDEGRVPMVWQDRAGAGGRRLLEVPAGKLDSPDEDPLECARRELEEETGIRAERWELLVHAYTSPAYCTERIAMYLATGLSQGMQRLDPGEYIEVEWIPLADLARLVMKGEVADMKSALCILMAFNKTQLRHGSS